MLVIYMPSVMFIAEAESAIDMPALKQTVPVGGWMVTSNNIYIFLSLKSVNVT